MNYIHHKIKSFHIIILLLFFSSCQAYHNTTSRYNAYFLAKEKMIEVENHFYDQHKEDFNNYLNVLPPIDTVAGIAKKTELKYVFDKASLPPKWHKSSKWVDDCFILIGKSRMYTGEIVHAQQAFKYVNTNSKDINARHAALIQLIRLYTFSEEYNNVEYLNNYIKQIGAPLSEENLRDYLLAISEYHQSHDKLDTVYRYVQYAVEEIRPIRKRTRTYYLLGQIALDKNEREEANLYFKQILKNNPTFEMEFQAKLMMQRSETSNNEAEYNELSKEFKKLLKDEKNKDFRDRIFYQKGLFQLENNHQEDALSSFKKGLNEKTNNNAQRAYLYLEAGKIFYKKEELENAAAYYDSAISNLPAKAKNYALIKKRAETLKNFVNHLKIKNKNEDLLNLASLPEKALNDTLSSRIEYEKKVIEDKYWADKKEQKQKDLEKANEALKKAGSTSLTSTVWYFYDISKINRGKKDFEKKWNQRALQDNWRREEALDGSTSLNIEENVDEISQDSSNLKELWSTIPSLSVRLKEIPLSDSSKTICHEKLSNALFNLGKIYLFELHEYNKAKETNDRLIDEYENYENITEVLYTMYQHCASTKKCSPQKYLQILEKNHPNSFYTKLIKDPGLLEKAYEEDKKVDQAYIEIYDLYEKHQYNTALKKIGTLINDNSNTTLMDKLVLMKIILESKTGDTTKVYLKKLIDFKENFKESKSLAYVDRLITAASKK